MEYDYIIQVNSANQISLNECIQSKDTPQGMGSLKGSYIYSYFQLFFS